MAFFIERPIPERPYFKVGEAARILGVAPSTVRYWQKEFPNHIKAELSRGGQNVFSRSDVIVMAVIMNLVRTDGMSIRDARARLSEVINEHGGRVDRIQLCLQFELPLASDEAALAPEPVDEPEADPVQEGEFTFAPTTDPVPDPDPDPDPVQAGECNSPLRAPAPVQEGECDSPLRDPDPAPVPDPDPVEEGECNSPLRDPDLVAGLTQEIESLTAMNEFLVEENLRLRRVLDEVNATSRASVERIGAVVRQMLSDAERETTLD